MFDIVRGRFKISLLMNLIIGGFLISWVIMTPKITIKVEAPSPYVVHAHSTLFFSNENYEEILRHYSSESDEKLLGRLFLPAEPLFSGFSTHDLAVSFLYQRGYTIDVPLKIIGRWPQEVVEFQSPSLYLFSSLHSQDIVAIQAFLRNEKAPYTAQKMFSMMKINSDSELQQLFRRTDEWRRLQILLKKQFGTDETVWNYIMLFSWKGIEELLALESKLVNEKELPMRLNECMIAEFMRTHSEGLARCLVLSHAKTGFSQSSPDFLAALLQKIPQDMNKEAVQLACSVIESPTKEDLFLVARKALSDRLQMAQIDLMSRKDLISALNKKSSIQDLVSLKQAPKKTVSDSKVVTPTLIPPKAIYNNSVTKVEERVIKDTPQQLAARDKISPYTIYTVRKGETLWSIAKKFHVHVDKIRYLNKIHGTILPPGMRLKIPNSSYAKSDERN